MDRYFEIVRVFDRLCVLYYTNKPIIFVLIDVQLFLTIAAKKIGTNKNHEYEDKMFSPVKQQKKKKNSVI